MDQLTEQGRAKAQAMLLKGFPAIDVVFIDLLDDRVKSLGFTDQRLMDAVLHVIDTCKYPTPAIADIVQFDRSIDLYTYPQLVKLNNLMPGMFAKHKRVEVYGRTDLYCHVNNIERLNLKIASDIQDPK